MKHTINYYKHFQELCHSTISNIFILQMFICPSYVQVMAVMSAYSLQRADMDAMSELTTWGAATDRDRDPLQGVSSKVCLP